MRIVVLYPRGYQSGGPEALHQLVDELRHQGAEALLAPLPNTEDAPRSPAYDVYDAPETSLDAIRDDDVVIASEASIKELLPTRGRRKVIWWLSVDNALPFKHTLALLDPLRRRQDLKEQGGLRATAHVFREAYWRLRLRRNRSVHHVAQSAYARHRVERTTRQRVAMLSDFTVTAPPSAAVARDIRLVAFNPAKGGDIALRAIAAAGGFTPLPLRGLTREQLGLALDSAGFYIDLGNHPGKDRLPREAALHGCIEIVAARGAGAFAEDLPLPEGRRISVSADLAASTGQAIARLAVNPDEARAAQTELVEGVTHERETFRAEVARFLASFGDANDDPRSRQAKRAGINP